VIESFIPGKLLRIYFAETHRYDGQPLADVLLEWARNDGVAGATVLPGVGGVGHHHQLHTTRLLELSHNLPRVVELVDTEEKIGWFVAAHSYILASTTMVLIDVQMHAAR
jgi:PII-like signaling protein